MLCQEKGDGRMLSTDTGGRGDLEAAAIFFKSVVTKNVVNDGGEGGDAQVCRSAMMMIRGVPTQQHYVRPSSTRWPGAETERWGGRWLFLRTLLFQLERQQTTQIFLSNRSNSTAVAAAAVVCS